jgi:hypothetical protein
MEINNSTHIFTPRGEIATAYFIYQITQSVLTVFWVFVFIPESYGFVQFIWQWAHSNRLNGKIDRQTIKIRTFLFANSFINLLCFTFLCVLAFKNDLTPIGCEILARGCK